MDGPPQAEVYELLANDHRASWLYTHMVSSAVAGVERVVLPLSPCGWPEALRLHVSLLIASAAA